MIRYATRLPPGRPVEILDNNLVRKTVKWAQQSNIGFMHALLEYLINNPDPLVVPIYNYEIFDNGYSYDMMRCGILDAEERALVDIVGFFWDKHKHLACHQPNEGLKARAATHPKLFTFLTKVTEQNRYLDLHSGNVMLTEDAEYCLVDIEGFIDGNFKNIDLETNGPFSEWMAGQK